MFFNHGDKVIVNNKINVDHRIVKPGKVLIMLSYRADYSSVRDENHNTWIVYTSWLSPLNTKKNHLPNWW